MSRTLARMLVVIAVVLPAMTSAQQRDSRAPILSAGTATVRGVVNDRRQSPIPNAIVRLACEGLDAQWTTLSDGNGRFAFESLPAGRCEVSAVKPGFVTEWFGRSASTPASERLQLTAGGTIDDVAFALVRAAVISGVVTLDGDPINAKVAASPFAAPGRPPATGGGSGMTDHLGRFRIGNLAPGEYIVSAEAVSLSELHTAGSDGRRLSFVLRRTHHPSTERVPDAQVIRLAEGEERDGIGVAVVALPAGRLSGRVTQPSGEAASDHQVFASLTTGLGSSTVAATASDGAFVFSALPIGDYEIRAKGKMTGDDGRTERGFVRGVVTVGTGTNAVALSLTPGAKVRGRVTIEGPVPVGLSVQLRVQKSSGMFASAVAADGTFAISDVEPGSFILTFATERMTQLSVDSVTIAGQPLPDGRLSLASGTIAENVHLHLAESGAEISGTVRGADGSPLRGVLVIAMSVAGFAPGLSGRLSAETDAAGRYRLTNVPKGSLSIAALVRIEAPQMTSQLFLPGTTPQTVVIDEKGQKKVVDFVRY